MLGLTLNGIGDARIPSTGTPRAAKQGWWGLHHADQSEKTPTPLS